MRRQIYRPGNLANFKGPWRSKSAVFYGFVLHFSQALRNLKLIPCAANALLSRGCHLESVQLMTHSVRELLKTMIRQFRSNLSSTLAFPFAVTLCFATTCPAQISIGQDDCCFQPSYQLQCETELVPQTVQRFRVAFETDYVNEEVTSYRPVLRSRLEEKEYRVARPVVETSFREERYTVWKPIVETKMREESVQQTRYVSEQREYDQQYTTFRPVVETQFYQQQYAVQRPVVETQMYQQQYAVQRPVVETRFRDQQYTTLRPQTTYQNRTFDAGGYVAQNTVLPGQVRYGLGWGRDLFPSRGPLGFVRYRGGFVAQPYVTPPSVQTQYAYQPNYVQQQIAQTQLVPETQSVRVPYQVQRTETDLVTQNVPVQTVRMQTDYLTQRIPVQSTRMIPTTQVRKIPYVVQRPVTETLTRKVPVSQQRWVQEEKVRKVPVRSTRLVYETQKRMVPVQFYEKEAITRTVRRPVTRRVYQPYNETVMVPRNVVQRAPLSYFDPYGAAIVSGFSPYETSVSSAAIAAPVVSNSVVVPEVTEPADTSNLFSDFTDGSGTKLSGPSVFDDEPQTVLKVESTLSGPSNVIQQPSEMGLNSADPDDLNPVDEPKIPATGASWRIKYNPTLARQI